MKCYDCGLPDNYRGDGDGIGSCDCPRCRDCGAPPGHCTADCDAADETYCPCGECEGCGWCDCHGPSDSRPVETVRLAVLDAPGRPQ